MVQEHAYPADAFKAGYGERFHPLARIGRARVWLRIHDDGSAEQLRVDAR